MFYEYKDKKQISFPGCGDKGFNVQKIMRLLSFISVGKLHTLLLCFIAIGVLHLISSVSELKSNQTRRTVRQERVLNDRTKPVFWLSAKDPDSGYMRHVQEAFISIGYERWDEKTSTWDVMWSYEYPFGKISAASLKPFQLVNHFPGSGYLTSKGYLAKSKSKYIPLAFSLPQDAQRFQEFVMKHPDKMWVQKSNNHRGIKIKSTQELDYSAPNSFIQEFVRHPYLVDGHKFDIGIYTVITSIDPLLVYVLDTEWLIRYCPEKYEPFDASNVRKYVVEDDYTPTWELPSLKDGYLKSKLSHKESLLRHIKLSGHNPDKTVEDLYAAVAELVWEKQENIMKSVSNYPFGSKSFFELVRFDFVLDADMNIYVMEVNMSPNLSSGHFSDNALMYRHVMYDTLSLVGIANDVRPRQDINLIEKEMQANDKLIVAFPEDCISCTSCDKEICKLCNICLTSLRRYQLKQAYNQHINKRNFKRVYPAPLSDQKTAMAYNHTKDPKPRTEADKAIALWFKGRCIQEKAWCL